MAGGNTSYNEIDSFLDARYVSASEANLAPLSIWYYQTFPSSCTSWRSSWESSHPILPWKPTTKGSQPWQARDKNDWMVQSKWDLARSITYKIPQLPPILYLDEKTKDVETESQTEILAQCKMNQRLLDEDDFSFYPLHTLEVIDTCAKHAWYYSHI